MQSHENIFELNCPILTTERLVLREPHVDDAQDIANLANNYEIARNMLTMPYPYFDADAKEFVESVLNEKRGGCHFAVTDAESGHLVGVAGVNDADPSRPYPHMGYWLGEPYWGKGYATEVAQALVDMYFKITDQDYLLASVLTNNNASKRVIEKCGGRFWKQDEVFSKAMGENQTLDQYRITRADWVAALAA